MRIDGKPIGAGDVLYQNRADLEPVPWTIDNWQTMPEPVVYGRPHGDGALQRVPPGLTWEPRRVVRRHVHRVAQALPVGEVNRQRAQCGDPSYGVFVMPSNKRTRR